jgi:hypothetical protein
MAYGHAERNLAVIRQLEAETRQLLARLAQPGQEHPPAVPEVADGPAEPARL